MPLGGDLSVRAGPARPQLLTDMRQVVLLLVMDVLEMVIGKRRAQCFKQGWANVINKKVKLCERRRHLHKNMALLCPTVQIDLFKRCRDEGLRWGCGVL
jgi:hypothetical protein